MNYLKANGWGKSFHYYHPCLIQSTTLTTTFIMNSVLCVGSVGPAKMLPGATQPPVLGASCPHPRPGQQPTSAVLHNTTTAPQHHSTMSHNVRYHHNGHSIWRKDKVEYRSIAKLNVKCYSIVSLQPKRPLLPLHNWQGEDHHFPPAGGLHLRVHLPLGLHHLHHPGQGQPGITFFNFGKNFQWPFITLFAGRN